MPDIDTKPPALSATSDAPVPPSPEPADPRRLAPKPAAAPPEANDYSAEAMARNWNERHHRLSVENPDYEALTLASDLPISEAMVSALFAADNGPDVAYQLGKNPDEAARIASLPPARQVLEIGKLSHEVGRTAAVKVRNTARQAAKTSPQPQRQRDPRQMTTEEYAAHRMPQLRAGRTPTLPTRPLGAQNR